MTDLLARLAARQLGEARLLKPQVPGLFEPQGDAGQTLVEESVERPAVPPLATREPPRQHEPELPRDRDPVVAPSDRPQRSDPAMPQSPTVRDPVVDKHEVRKERHVTHETHREHIHETHRVTHHEHIHLGEEPEKDTPKDPGDIAEAHATEAERPEPQKIVPTPETPQETKTAEPFLQPVVRSLQQQPQVPRTEFPAPQERRVEVHIGHLEIRTTPPPKPNPRPRRSATNPAPDLNTYLGGRS